MFADEYGKIAREVKAEDASRDKEWTKINNEGRRA
jgi:hypothetical protein